MSLDKAGLQTALQTAFSGTHSAADSAALLANAIDAYVKTGTVDFATIGAGLFVTGLGPVTGTTTASGGTIS